MATKTSILKLIKPGLGEFFDTWYKPINDNADIIDTAVGSIQEEITAARGSQTDLATRLANGLNDDGTLQPAAEVVTARSSSVYGSVDANSVDFTLDGRLEAGDLEVWRGRQGLATLKDALAWVGDGSSPNSVLSAASNYLTYSGSVVTLNGLATPMVANINGYRSVIRTNKTAVVAGSAGSYYMYLDITTPGDTFLTGTTTGTTSTYIPNSKLSKFSATAVNFVTAGVKVGDVLQILSPVGNLNVGNFIVQATNVEDSTNLATNELRVIGEFTSLSSGLTWQIQNASAPTFGVTNVAHAKTFTRVANRIYIGRCVFDGTNITSIVQYALKGSYAAFTQVTGNFSIAISHNIGYFPKKVLVYGSQANDFSQPLELLSVADISGGGALQRSVIAQMSDVTISIKNATTGVFYKDFGGTTQTSGYLYVVVER